jgi:hypothetical protein
MRVTLPEDPMLTLDIAREPRWLDLPHDPPRRVRRRNTRCPKVGPLGIGYDQRRVSVRCTASCQAA